MLSPPTYALACSMLTQSLCCKIPSRKSLQGKRINHNLPMMETSRLHYPEGRKGLGSKESQFCFFFFSFPAWFVELWTHHLWEAGDNNKQVKGSLRQTFLNADVSLMFLLLNAFKAGHQIGLQCIKTPAERISLRGYGKRWRAMKYIAGALLA